METGRPPPLAVPVGQLFGPEHRPPGDSPSLTSPPLFSLGHCLRLVVSVLFCFFLFSAAPLGDLALGSVLLGVVVYDTVLYCFQPRPE